MSGHEPGGSPHQVWGPRGTAHWDNLSERRLDDVGQQVRDARQDLGKLREELHSEARRGDNQKNLLERLDERLIEVIRRLEDLRGEVQRGSDQDNKRFVNKDEFEPVKKAVFTVIGAICLAVVAALARVVLR